jgi:hypothetical protein
MFIPLIVFAGLFVIGLAAMVYFIRRSDRAFARKIDNLK